MDMNVYKKLVQYIIDFCRNNNLKPDEAALMLGKCKIDVLRGMLEDKSDLFVLKKDDSVEKFDKKKLIISIEGASDEIQKPLNSGDIENIVHSVLNKLKKENPKVVSTHTIRTVALETLKDLGFNDVYESYKEFIK